MRTIGSTLCIALLATVAAATKHAATNVGDKMNNGGATTISYIGQGPTATSGETVVQWSAWHLRRPGGFTTWHVYVCYGTFKG
ncbi:hypothetical protein DNM18_26745 [Salmonella enterica subsp. enterica]|nr:hypothetical protein [Salmonella enterica subsp. enterica serovar Poona]